jgi:hypothetical protein
VRRAIALAPSRLPPPTTSRSTASRFERSSRRPSILSDQMARRAARITALTSAPGSERTAGRPIQTLIVLTTCMRSGFKPLWAFASSPDADPAVGSGATAAGLPL